MDRASFTSSRLYPARYISITVSTRHLDSGERQDEMRASATLLPSLEEARGGPPIQRRVQLSWGWRTQGGKASGRRTHRAAKRERFWEPNQASSSARTKLCSCASSPPAELSGAWSCRAAHAGRWVRLLRGAVHLKRGQRKACPNFDKGIRPQAAVPPAAAPAASRCSGAGPPPARTEGPAPAASRLPRQQPIAPCS